MDKVQRKKNPKADTELLLSSKRRCCLCFGLRQDLTEKRGQVAHLDHDPSNDNTDNLAFLCLEHHDQYDSRTSQSKSIQINEIKAYREKLYRLMETSDININEQTINSLNKKESKQKSVKALNAWLCDKPHKCNYCRYSFSIMPDIEEGKGCFVKQATCPKCGNIDEVCRVYEG